MPTNTTSGAGIGENTTTTAENTSKTAPCQHKRAQNDTPKQEIHDRTFNKQAEPLNPSQINTYTTKKYPQILIPQTQNPNVAQTSTIHQFWVMAQSTKILMPQMGFHGPTPPKR